MNDETVLLRKLDRDLTADLPHYQSAVALVPVYNEEEKILHTLDCLLKQTVPFEHIIVGINNTTDGTWHKVLDFAKWHPTVRVIDFGHVPQRKSEALNRMYAAYCNDTDLVVTVDGDTELLPDTLEIWKKEFQADPQLAATSARFTMYPDKKRLLVRLQRLEFAQGIELHLRHGWTTVNPGAGTAYRNVALRALRDIDVIRQRRPKNVIDRPWPHDSETEDFWVTCQLRANGWKAVISPKARAYTDGMPTFKTLWKQRLKWQAGGIKDIMKFGWTPQTRYTWLLQVRCLIGLSATLLWLTLQTLLYVTQDKIVFQPYWLVIPLIFALRNVKYAFFTPNRDWIDILICAVLIPQLLYSWLELGWAIASWAKVIKQRITGRTEDLWAAQYKAETGKEDVVHAGAHSARAHDSSYRTFGSGSTGVRAMAEDLPTVTYRR